MEYSLEAELIKLLTALMLGTLAGLLYDLLRPLRYRGGAAAGLIYDILFCGLSGTGVFIYFMCQEDASAGMWQLILIPAGFLAYEYSLSGFILPIFTCLLEFFIKFYTKSEKNIKNLLNSAKNIFQNVR